MLGEIIGALHDADSPAVQTARHGMPEQLVAAAIQICEVNRFQSVIARPGWLLPGVGRCLSRISPRNGPLSAVAVKRTGDHGAMAIPPSGPFVPGAGHVPPHLDRSRVRTRIDCAPAGFPLATTGYGGRLDPLRSQRDREDSPAGMDASRGSRSGSRHD